MDKKYQSPKMTTPKLGSLQSKEYKDRGVGDGG